MLTVNVDGLVRGIVASIVMSGERVLAVLVTLNIGMLPGQAYVKFRFVAMEHVVHVMMVGASYISCAGTALLSYGV